MTRILKVDELIQRVTQQAGISPAEAKLAISAILDYLTARLPSTVVGRIHEQLSDAQSSHDPDCGQGGIK
jgi:hypothetical protein